jgi:hypothetical protein
VVRAFFSRQVEGRQNPNQETNRIMSSGSCNWKRHLGVDFAIWRSEGTWFWLLISASGEGGTIGASANEAQAMHDACLSIEEESTVF